MFNWINRLAGYCSESNHPWIQIFYFIIGPFLYTACWLLIFRPREAVVGDSAMYVAHTLAALGFYNYLRAWLADPGVVTKENNSLYIEKYARFYDGSAFKAQSECPTCKLPKSTNQTRPIQALRRLQPLRRPLRPPLSLVDSSGSGTASVRKTTRHFPGSFSTTL